MKLRSVKISGDLIAPKYLEEEFDSDAAGRLAQEFCDGMSGSDCRSVLFHGTGGFGHPLARRLESQLESDDFAVVYEAATLVRLSVLELHRLFMRELRMKKVPVAGFSPFQSFVGMEGGEVAVNADIIMAALANEVIPVLHGDMIFDRDKGMSICSSETAMVELTRVWRNDGIEMGRGIIACGLDGVLKNVDEPDEGIFEVVSTDNASDVLAALRRHNGSDVSGGMAHKLNSAFEMARMGVETLFVNGRVPGRFEAALRGGDVVGTVVRAM